MQALKRSDIKDTQNRFATGEKVHRRGDPRIYEKGADGYLYIYSEPEHLPGTEYTDHKGVRYRVLSTGQHVRVHKKSKLTKAQRKAIQALRRATKGEAQAIVDEEYEPVTEQQAADKESMILNSEEV